MDTITPSFWKTVRILFVNARTRSAGRRHRQQQLMNSAKRSSPSSHPGLGFLLAILFMAILNGFAAFAVREAVLSAMRVELEQQGKLVVSQQFYNEGVESRPQDHPAALDELISSYSFYSESNERSKWTGESPKREERHLREEIHAHGLANLVPEEDSIVRGLAETGTLASLVGSCIFLIWALMLACQGEGLDLDLGRRRHPMWEWLLSHPAPPGAIFLAEMLSPIAANPAYWAAPLFLGGLYGMVYGFWGGAAAAFVAGVPVSVAGACLGKALEIGVTLRFPPRSRGPILGIMAWFGFASFFAFFFGGMYAEQIFGRLSHLRFLSVLGAVPFPLMKFIVGARSGGPSSFLFGVVFCWILAGGVIAASVGFSLWGTARGLSGNFSVADTQPVRSRIRFGKEPLYRKELLWFARDRGAIVQCLLIPITVAFSQAFNFRGIFEMVGGSWTSFCGAAILFGTYFLWVLGPKSLNSEGNALWIALTWPRGLESLLKAKARLWAWLSTGVVILILSLTAYAYSFAAWKILLVGIGWFAFGYSMAEKSVTLVTVTPDSGEPQPVPRGRRWAAQLGMLTFAVGVMSQQWHVAVMGIVYSWITAAAMWQNFRARIPYLYDPWSETAPPPPTVMHAMVAISILVELGAVVVGIVVAATGPGGMGLATAFSYGLCAVVVCIGTAMFLSERDVTLSDTWCWNSFSESIDWFRADGTNLRLVLTLLLGIAGGAALGVFGIGYQALLHHIPSLTEILRKSHEQVVKNPGFKQAFFVMAVFFAPFAEEYLFRGLLYRALDREWGGWRAIFGSAAFFCVYHPALAWPPVFLLGAFNAFLFKKTGRLAPAVLTHMVYNAIVLWRM